MAYGNSGGYQFGPNGLQIPNDEGYSQSLRPKQIGMNPDPTMAQAGAQGWGAGIMGGLKQFGMGALPNMLFGSRGGPMATLGQYGLKQALGGAGMKALGMAIPGIGQAQLVGALLPAALGGLSSLGRSLGIGRHTGPSAQELAMGEAKGNLANMRGSFGSDMSTGRSMLDKYNPMLDAQIGRLQDLANRGLSTEYNTRQMAGAASQTEAARRAAEARMKATGGMIGGGQALSGFGGINQAAVGGMAQGAYNAAINDMNQQPGYINQLTGMIGSQINRGQGLFDAGRAGMMGLDQQLYGMNAQEKARADQLSQANRDREAAAIGGIAQLGATYLGDQANERQMNRLMDLYAGNDKTRLSAISSEMSPQLPGQIQGVGSRQFNFADGSGMTQPEYPYWAQRPGSLTGGGVLSSRVPRLGNMNIAQDPQFSGTNEFRLPVSGFRL